MNKPRIYLAIATFLPIYGGAETQALLHCRSLRARGYDATILTLRHDRRWPRHEVIDGVPVIRVAGWPLGGRERLPGPLRRLCFFTGLLVMGWALWRRRQHYDVLNVYQLNLTVWPSALVCRLTGTPLAVTVVSTRSAASNTSAQLPNNVSSAARCNESNSPRLPADSRTAVGGDLEQVERLGKLGVRFTRLLVERAGAVLVVLSTRMKTYLAEYNFALSRMRLIPNGVDIGRFSPISQAHDERARVVMCIARLDYLKGVDVLLYAWRLVHEQCPDAQLVIVGSGSMYTRLAQIVEALGIQDSVEFTGAQQDVVVQLRRGGLAVLPSRTEGMPMALLEAMACGLPCVATRVSGSEDVIQHGVNGLLVEPEDAEGLARALLTLLRDPILAQRYARVGRDTIEKHYSLEHITDMYMELYGSMIGSGRPPASRKSRAILGWLTFRTGA